MGLINPILVNATNANDSTAVGGSIGSVVYQINTTTNRCDTFIYYQAKDAVAIVLGSVLEPADILFTTGTPDRAGGSAITGNSGVTHFFFGIAQASMTQNYYGYAQRTGRAAVVNTETPAAAVGDLLCLSATADGEAALVRTIASTPTAAQIESAMASVFGFVTVAEVAGTPDTSVVMLCPSLSLVGG